MHVRRSLVATALAPLLLGLGLSGCQEAEPEPKMPKVSASTPSPTETATAEEETPEEFIRRWTEVSFVAQNGGDTSTYRSLTPNCDPCTSFADQVDGIYESGGSIEINRLVVRSVSKTEVAGKFNIVRMSSRTRVSDSNGVTTQEFPGGREALTVSLKKGADGWSVTDYVRVAS